MGGTRQVVSQVILLKGISALTALGGVLSTGVGHGSTVKTLALHVLGPTFGSYLAAPETALA